MANKNEAKIKFTAETADFNKQIAKSADEYKTLGAELKLTDAEMQTNGRSIEGLEKKHGLLGEQLAASQDKTEALQQKLQKAVEIFGENSRAANDLRRQLTNAKTAEEKIRKAINDVNNELEKQTAESKKTETATERLTGEIDKQEGEVKRLKKQYADLVVEGRENTEEAKDLAKQIDKLSGELKDNKKAFNDAEKAADKFDRSLEEAGDSAKEAGDGFTVMKGVVSNLASEAIQFGIDKVAEFTDYLMGLPEATREIRQDFATLETSFEGMGFNTETATKTWKDLYGIFGEDDRAVEAANLIAKMSDSQADLNNWVTITKGVWGSYQDSLPVEGLAEASNETAKTGKVTGVLADALNWSSEAADMFADYMSEDVTTAEDAFNEALAECTTEAERQALIQETLTKLYGDAAKKYDEASGSLTAEKEAAAESILVQNELAETMAPLTTEFESLKTEMLSALLPAITKFSEWGTSALGWMKEHPTTVKAIAAALAVVAIGITAVSIAWGIMNAVALMSPVTWIILGVVAAIAAVVAIIVVCVEYWDEIMAAGKNAWEGIKNAWNSAVEWFKGIWNGIVSGVKGAWSAVTGWFSNMWTGIQNTFASIGSWFSEKFTAAKQGVQNAWAGVKNWFSNVWNGVKNVFSNVGSWFSEKFNSAKQGVTNIWNGVKGFFSGIYSNIKNTFANVKDAIFAPFKNAIDKVKGIFNALKLKFPNIKLPHFKVSPAGWKIGDLLKGSIPKLGIEWYAKGAILKKPTLFGMNGNNAMIGGERGHEAIAPIDKLQGYVAEAVSRNTPQLDIERLIDSIEELASRPIDLNVNGKNFARATASDTDNVSGRRVALKNRGLAID